ncbi:zinc dependent phospholipase C family protein [Sporomusa acidovorans]|uniref:zinc dependent phospholipase C family protein n=1 Tax=Sporomusa acidovorans TaxID=112900 RepID=UPI000885E51D|nr:zinc dependent phospholipase C family protein [Sporomusa acidovorans]OZC18947.1 hypothetical protein SPACI_30330 [Sporomusa acidovorans DSM 3132]SDD70039.1 Zinc dependent phospholipase C [Sporomusa acidovorans]
MCQPITHFLVAKKGLEQLPFVQENGALLAFGSFGPDLFYLLSGKTQHADTIHASGSFEAFCSMLNVAKNTYSYNVKSGEKQLTFAMGFYAHVIADCVFHPYVYRKSLDHWAEHDVAFELLHKKVEASIDQIIQEEIIGDQIGIPNPLLCLGDDGLLDQDIAYLFHQALTTAYPRSIGEDLAPYATEEEKHPLQQAYQKYCKMPKTLYGIHNILFRVEKYAEGALPEQLEEEFLADERQKHLQRSSWPPSDVISPFTYNYIDMFNMAAHGVRMMGNAVESFIQSDGNMQAIDFLHGHNCSYLDQDWNLDTGLPSLENTNSQLMDKSHLRFEYGIAVLEEMYNKLQRA